MSRRFAIVSIGTNSTRLLLADVEPEVPRLETVRWAGTRLGEGLGERGNLGDEPMQRTLDAIEQFRREIKGHYVRLFAIATSAVRRADNGEDFSKRVAELLGTPLRVLPGEEEATASYRGALTAFGKLRGERVGVLDIGGGSTEYAVGAGAEPEKVGSCEIGAVRITEAVPELAGRDGPVKEKTVERAREIAREALKPLKEFPPVERLAFVGGSATTSAAILRESSKMVMVHPVTRDDLERVLQRLLPMPLEERKAVPGMRPQRADILSGGIIVLQSAMDIIGCDRALATRYDLLLGVLLRERDASAGQPQGAPAARTRKGLH